MENLQRCGHSDILVIRDDPEGQVPEKPQHVFPDLSPDSPPPGLSPPLKTKSSKEMEEEDWSDADTLVHNMSEGSFDKVSPSI